MDTYYHINNSPNCNWATGDEIQVGLYDNYMWRSFLERGDFVDLGGEKYSSDMVVRHAYEHYTRHHPAPGQMKHYHFNPIFTLKEANDSLGNALRIIRELAFESVRKEFYPELPSRQKCIWLIPRGSQSFDFWKSIIPEKNQRIFKVEVDGKTHRAAQKWLIGGTIPLDEINSKAHKYWRGDDSGSFEDEILFSGKVKIIEELAK